MGKVCSCLRLKLQSSVSDSENLRFSSPERNLLVEEGRETENDRNEIKVLDISPSGATGDFFEALRYLLNGVKLIVIQKEDWGRDKNVSIPVIVICHNFSRLGSDIQPVIELKGKRCKSLLVIFCCKQVNQPPLIPLSTELKKQLPANIEIVQMEFDINARSKSISPASARTSIQQFSGVKPKPVLRCIVSFGCCCVVLIGYVLFIVGRIDVIQELQVSMKL